MNPISSTSIPPLSNNDTTQVIIRLSNGNLIYFLFLIHKKVFKVVNSLAGQKPLQLKVRLQYSFNLIPVNLINNFKYFNLWK